MSRILITGGAGFIGSHLAERLVEQGHTVTVWDNFSTGKDANMAMRHTPVVRKVDCRDINAIDQLYEWSEGCVDVKPDFIYHLAATVGVHRVIENPSACMENNIQSLHRVLGLGIPGLFTSTSEVHGKATGRLREDGVLEYTSKSRWSYAASKLIGEWMALQAKWKVVRLFNVVGPRQSSEYGAVLPRFVKQALEGEPLTVYGDGSQVRTFIDVRDCVEILDELREKEFDVVNIGGEHVMSIKELAQNVNLALRSAANRNNYVNISYANAYKEGFEDCQERIPDLTKLDKLLPSRPYTEFSKTIRDLAASMKQEEVNA